MLVITLSSIPPRFSRIGPTLQSLLAQNAKPDAIYLYIPETYHRFPDWDGTLPQIPKGVEIRRCAQDYGPATKILPAAQAHRGKETEILFCDDDRAYAPNWARSFLDARRNHPDAAITMRGLMADGLAGTSSVRQLQPRALPRSESRDFNYQLKRLRRLFTGPQGRPERRLFRRSGFIDMFEGCSGVLVRPDWFDDDAFDIPDVVWRVDDIWLSGMLAKNGIPIWLLANHLTPENTDAQAHAPLAGEVIDGVGRHQTNQAAIRHMQNTYGVWLG